MRRVFGWAGNHKVATTVIVVLVLALIGSAGRNPNAETGGAGATATPTTAPTPSPVTATDSPSVEPSHEPFVIDFEDVPDADGETISVTGGSNLPDGAILNVSIARPFRNEGEVDVREVSAGRVDVSLVAGRFSARVPLDESDMLVGVDPQFRIAVVADSLSVCVTFQTGSDLDDQPRQSDPAVVEAVGPNGESLVGSPQLEVFGSLSPSPANWLELFKMVPSHSPLVSEIERRQGSPPAEGSLEGFCLT